MCVGRGWGAVWGGGACVCVGRGWGAVGERGAAKTNTHQHSYFFGLKETSLLKLVSGPVWPSGKAVGW